MKNNMHFNKYHKTIKSALFNKKIEELEKYIKFKDKLEVKYFISGNPFLLDIIKESSGIINGIFKDRRLEISVENDPESITDFKFLYLKIYTEETPAKAINLLKKFDYEWWLGIKPNTKNKLVIGVEYE
ncbi:hypothetical protein [Ferroplasma sp.]|uniref:hypothetical protein n=1 Tax=Ferroplasma sp. TaxID=2591003 RepID=UPI00307F490B